jgi:hypothetical protein
LARTLGDGAKNVALTVVVEATPVIATSVHGLLLMEQMDPDVNAAFAPLKPAMDTEKPVPLGTERLQTVGLFSP